MDSRPEVSEDMGVGKIGIVLGALMTLETALGCKCAPAGLPMAPEMKPAETQPKRIDVNSVVFIGRVTATGPSLHSIRSYMKARLSRKDLETMEQSESVSLPEIKRIGLRLLPKKLHSRLRKASSEEEIEALYYEFFGLNEEGRRPVRFAVEETLEGEKMSRREVWTGFGSGDCGFPFELGKRYRVDSYRNEKSGREETGICTATREIQN